ncbi:MAG: acetyl-CoA C-acyltransferase [Alphaproteobacteria bacterium]|nr:acetyl-CoA C-acyltransferase [Alphaproteobacteria bacterium]MCK5555733.1 acetyl-CoA C-acyltransferase [Alphaproteobacteria bacterium]
MQNNDPVVIVGMARTPMGSFQGELAGFTATDLGKAVIEEAVKRSGLKVDDIDDVIMGCVLSAGQGQAPARQAAIMAGLPDSTGAMTINKVCGSGMKAAMLAHDSLLVGTSSIMVVGGMESMSNAPYLLDKARAGYRLGHGKLYDHMFLDGLEDAYQKGQAMGVFADETAKKLQITREEQDEFALTSLARALRAVKEGDFKSEIVPLKMKTRKKGEVIISEDESPKRGRPDKIPKLRPAFSPDGTVTAASSSSISDGAAAMVMMRMSEAKKRGLKVIAVVKAHATHSQKPSEFTLAPIEVTRKVMEKASWSVEDVELFEINEAFAVVTLAAMRGLNLPHDKVNVNGGACALGHPIGASGARIIVTLLSALEKRGLKKGVASLCIGGGEAVSMALELAE